MMMMIIIIIIIIIIFSNQLISFLGFRNFLSQCLIYISLLFLLLYLYFVSFLFRFCGFLLFFVAYMFFCAGFILALVLLSLHVNKFLLN